MSKRMCVTLAGLALAAMVLALPGLSPAFRARAAAQEQSPAQALTEAQEAMQTIVVGEDGAGWLGVTVAEVTAEKVKELKLPAERGVLLKETEADGPAAKAGLKANDVITEVNGQPVEGTMQFRRMIREMPPGRTMQLTIWREGRAQSVSVQLGNLRERFEGRGRAFGPKGFEFHFDMPEISGRLLGRGPMLGIEAEDLSGQLGSYFGVPEGEGVLVREVRPGTPAEKAGLKAGDVITKLDAERVRTVSELRQKMREKREKKTVSVSVMRKGAEMSLNLEVEQPKPPEAKKKIISRRTSI
jgi:serine protease Do